MYLFRNNIQHFQEYLESTWTLFFFLFFFLYLEPLYSTSEKEEKRGIAKFWMTLRDQLFRRVDTGAQIASVKGKKWTRDRVVPK